MPHPPAIADLTNFVTSPDPISDLGRVKEGLGPALELYGEPVLHAAADGAIAYTVPSVGLPVSSVAGLYNPVTVGETAVTVVR